MSFRKQPLPFFGHSRSLDFFPHLDPGEPAVGLSFTCMPARQGSTRPLFDWSAAQTANRRDEGYSSASGLVCPLEKIPKGEGGAGFEPTTCQGQAGFSRRITLQLRHPPAELLVRRCSSEYQPHNLQEMHGSEWTHPTCVGLASLLGHCVR